MPSGTGATPPCTWSSNWKAILAAAGPEKHPVVSIILDGENAWEHFPYNGYYFFDDLYGLLAAHPDIRTTTYAELLARAEPPRPVVLPRLTAGSWVYGTLSTWIGDEAKNRGWDLLCEAKQSCDRVLASGRLDRRAGRRGGIPAGDLRKLRLVLVVRRLQPAAAVTSFDSLYRRNLERLYHLLHLEPPASLAHPICAGSESASGGSMRRVTVRPILNLT
jgi:hypothetical protein